MKDISTVKHTTSKATTTTTTTNLRLSLKHQHHIDQHSNTNNHHNHQNAQLPLLRRGSRKGPPREHQRCLQRLLRRLRIHLQQPRIFHTNLPQPLHHLQPTAQPHKRLQGLESPQEAPPRDELCLCRLLQPQLLSLRISLIVYCEQPEAERRGIQEERRCCACYF